MSEHFWDIKVLKVFVSHFISLKFSFIALDHQTKTKFWWKEVEQRPSERWRFSGSGRGLNPHWWPVWRRGWSAAGILPSMLRSAVVLSVPQSQVYAPALFFNVFLMTSVRFLPSDWTRMFLEGKISLPSLNHFTSAAALLSSQDSITSSFSTEV